MSTTQQSYIAVEEPKAAARPISLARLADYLELTKPRISTMALISVALGYTLGSAHSWSLLPLIHALFGIGLVAVGCNSLNQLLEIKSDQLMPRTTGRPLPSGRLSVSEVLVFGILCALTGIFYLALMVNLLTAFLAAAVVGLFFSSKTWKVSSSAGAASKVMVATIKSGRPIRGTDNFPAYAQKKNTVQATRLTATAVYMLGSGWLVRATVIQVAASRPMKI